MAIRITVGTDTLLFLIWSAVDECEVRIQRSERDFKFDRSTLAGSPRRRVRPKRLYHPRVFYTSASVGGWVTRVVSIEFTIILHTSYIILPDA